MLVLVGKHDWWNAFMNDIHDNLKPAPDKIGFLEKISPFPLEGGILPEWGVIDDANGKER